MQSSASIPALAFRLVVARMSRRRHCAPIAILLSALVREFDRYVPGGADDPWASVGVGFAGVGLTPDHRFQEQNELLGKHDAAPAGDGIVGFVAAKSMQFNHFRENTC